MTDSITKPVSEFANWTGEACAWLNTPETERHGQHYRVSLVGAIEVGTQVAYLANSFRDSAVPKMVTVTQIFKDGRFRLSNGAVFNKNHRYLGEYRRTIVEQGENKPIEKEYYWPVQRSSYRRPSICSPLYARVMELQREEREEKERKFHEKLAAISELETEVRRGATKEQLSELVLKVQRLVVS